jgi:hypothetical protein
MSDPEPEPHIVTVYADPITRTQPEGNARVLRIRRQRNQDLLFCKVRFKSGPEPRDVYRWIHVDQLRAAGFTVRG